MAEEHLYYVCHPFVHFESPYPNTYYFSILKLGIASILSHVFSVDNYMLVPFRWIGEAMALPCLHHRKTQKMQSSWLMALRCETCEGAVLSVWTLSVHQSVTHGAVADLGMCLCIALAWTHSLLFNIANVN